MLRIYSLIKRHNDIKYYNISLIKRYVDIYTIIDKFSFRGGGGVITIFSRLNKSYEGGPEKNIRTIKGGLPKAPKQKTKITIAPPLNKL